MVIESHWRRYPPIMPRLRLWLEIRRLEKHFRMKGARRRVR